jgi:hypothetical protein
MEIKEVWTEFKDRITSPLFGSFVLSWLICNWRIPVVLIFYKHSELIATKTTYIDVIVRYTDRYISFLIPAAFSLGYTFIYPFIKRWINVYTAIRTRETDEALLKVGKDAMVSLNVLLKTKGDLKKKESELSELLISEGQILDINKDLETRVTDLQISISTLKEQHTVALNELNNFNAEEISSIKSSHEIRISSILESESAKLDAIKETYHLKLQDKDVVIEEKNKSLKLQGEIITDERGKIDQLIVRITSKDQEISLLKSNITNLSNEIADILVKKDKDKSDLKAIDKYDADIFAKVIEVTNEVMVNNPAMYADSRALITTLQGLVSRRINQMN